MKIAVFTTLWNEEVFEYYYNGFNKWAKENESVVDIFACYGRVDLEDPFNRGEYSIFRLPKLEEYDGIVIVSSTINSKEIRDLIYEDVRNLKKPCVLFDAQEEGLSSIGMDQSSYFCQMVHHMIEQHQSQLVAYVGGISSNVEAVLRLNGFYQGMQECEATIKPEYVFEKSFSYQDGIDVIYELIEQGMKMPDAIICANDEMAMGVCDALQEKGFLVGKQIHVSGFDNYFSGENYSPRLTTVKRPREALAYRACDMIANQIQHGVSPKNVSVSGSVIYGESCGCGKDVCGNHEAFRQMVFRKENNRIMLHEMLDYMEERILSGEGIENMITKVIEVLERFHKGRCRIMGNPMVEQRLDSDFDSYRKCTKEVVCWDVEENSSLKGHAYIYAPIHFMEHLYGYCVCRDIQPFLTDKGLYNFTKSIGYSVENVLQKQRLKLLNQRLEALYETDSLTGVYNRHGMINHARVFFQQAMEQGKKVEIIFVDIDNLKYINDNFGHEKGDIAISLVGKALTEFWDKHSEVFRYGGDEFVVLRNSEMPFETFTKGVEEFLQEQQKAQQLPFPLSASIGCIVANPEDEKELEYYIQLADTQMYEIKQARHKGN